MIAKYRVATYTDRRYSFARQRPYHSAYLAVHVAVRLLVRSYHWEKSLSRRAAGGLRVHRLWADNTSTTMTTKSISRRTVYTLRVRTSRRDGSPFFSLCNSRGAVRGMELHNKLTTTRERYVPPEFATENGRTDRLTEAAAAAAAAAGLINPWTARSTKHALSTTRDAEYSIIPRRSQHLKLVPVDNTRSRRALRFSSSYQSRSLSRFPRPYDQPPPVSFRSPTLDPTLAASAHTPAHPPHKPAPAIESLVNVTCHGNFSSDLRNQRVTLFARFHRPRRLHNHNETLDDSPR